MGHIGRYAAVTADPAAEEHRDRRLDQSFTPSDFNSVCSYTSRLSRPSSRSVLCAEGLRRLWHLAPEGKISLGTLAAMAAGTLMFRH